MLYNYAVTPLADNEIEARVADIVDCVRRGVYTMPLFMMALTPEGNPLWDKVKKPLELYEKYRDLLTAQGVPSGVLIQASLGHGYPLEKHPFQPLVQLTNGEEIHACCPLDPAFLEHFADVMGRIAAAGPKVIMLDDDFRLLVRPGKGCACPRHLAAVAKETGKTFSRESLFEHIKTHPATDPVSRAFAKTQKDALVNAATVFRAAIDAVDPTIQGVNCTSGAICEAVDETSRVFAGKGNPSIVRVPNGSYAPLSTRGFSHAMRQAAVCKSKLKKRGVDVVLAETDTIHFTRYGKSARYLHAQFAASLLEGLKGAKHWLTRNSAFEPLSGKAYRDILATHTGLYEKIESLADDIRFVGVGAAFTEMVDFDFNCENPYTPRPQPWVTKTLERLGLPFYFTDNGGKAVLIEGDIAADMRDDEIQTAFHGSVIVDGFAAKILCERGYAHLLGVDVAEWDLGRVSSESFDGTLYTCCTKQKHFKKLTVNTEKTQVLSHNMLRQDGKAKLLAPAVTLLPREEGITVVFCGSPNAEFLYTEGFSYLNETRKAQLVSILQKADALPVYWHGDDEMCLRAGYIADGRLLVACFLLGIDPVEIPCLYLQTPPKSITALQPDGSERSVAFHALGDNLYTLDCRIETLYPCILLIE